jgi:hypothetical protein
MSCERYEIEVAPSAEQDYNAYMTDRLKRAVSALRDDPEDDPKRGRFPYQPRRASTPEAVGDPMEPGHVLVVIEGNHAIRVGYRIDRDRCLVTIAAVQSAPYLL